MENSQKFQKFNSELGALQATGFLIKTSNTPTAAINAMKPHFTSKLGKQAIEAIENAQNRMVGKDQAVKVAFDSLLNRDLKHVVKDNPHVKKAMLNDMTESFKKGILSEKLKEHNPLIASTLSQITGLPQKESKLIVEKATLLNENHNLKVENSSLKGIIKNLSSHLKHGFGQSNDQIKEMSKKPHEKALSQENKQQIQKTNSQSSKQSMGI